MSTLSLLSECGLLGAELWRWGVSSTVPTSHLPITREPGWARRKGSVGAAVWAGGAEWAPSSLFSSNAINTSIHVLQRRAEAGCPRPGLISCQLHLSALIISKGLNQHLLHSSTSVKNGHMGKVSTLTVFFLITTLKWYEENQFHTALTAVQ